jgi:hypothetical protein
MAYLFYREMYCLKKTLMDYFGGIPKPLKKALFISINLYKVRNYLNYT